MSLFLRTWVAVLVLGIALSSNVLAGAQVGTFEVLGRSHVDGYHAVLIEADWSWLRSKDVLILGDSSPDYAPLGMVNNGRDYEGVTADYAQLLSELLNVRVEVRRYASRAEVIDGLKRAEVDFLGNANGYEAADAGLLMSTAYAEDMPGLVTQLGDGHELSPDLAGKKIAMLYHYLSPEAVKALYPKASLQLFPSNLSAIGAVAFGSADVYLGDALSANFLINKNYLNNVQLADFSRIEASNFSFAMSHDNTRMQRILNRALAAIPVSERMNIQRRWSAGGSSMPSRKALQFSVSEQRWMDAHPRVRVAVDDNFLPLSFLNEDNEFRGISADVLTKVSLRTGLKFDVQRAASVADMVEKVRVNDADLLITLTPSTSREGVLRFTRPYLNTPYVLVTGNNPTSPSTLDEMAGRRLAMINGNPVRDLIIEQYPRIELVEVRDAQELMALVADGRADAGVNSLIIARYLISHEYREQLRITSTVGTQLARTAFATSRGSLELYSILEKALLSISPEELDEVTNRWRSDIAINDSYWLRNRTVIIQGFALAALLLLVAMVWIAYLRRLVRTRREAEIALNDQLEFMHVLIDGTPHSIYVRDRHGRLVLCNSGYLSAFSVDRSDVIGTTVMEGVLSNPVEAAKYHEDYLQAMEMGVPRVEDRCLTMGSGQILTIYHWILPYRDSDGEVNGMIGGWIDISERQQLLEALREAKNQADDASRAKTTFLATMSHEIRTPMNAIIGMLELAQKKGDDGYMDRNSIDVVSNAAHGLLDLIGDILDIARIESGRLSLAPERANLLVLIESVARIFEGLARQKHLRLILDLDATLNREVLVDPLRLKQVISNLLSNAIKFTAVGQVRLDVGIEPSPNDDRLALCLRVEDSGSGISLDDQQRLFSPFSQASNHGQAARSGSGLGLMISRTLCEMMGGTLTLSSVLGQGTQVEVRLALPTLLPVDEPAPSSAVATQPAQVLNVLVIDDYPANRLLLTQQLSFLGHQVSDAADGAHGLRAWRSQHFDVVITDCSMPIMNGYELARAIRDEERSRGLAPSMIIGLTANAQPEEKGRCLDAGMNECLFKPISLNDLSARLAYLAPEGEVAPLEQVSPSPTIDGIDLSSLVRLSRGDDASIRSLLQDLATSNEQDMAQLIRLFAQHDLSGLSDLAHRVKGGARIIQAHALIECCDALEAGCKGFNSVVLTDAVDALQQAMEQLGQRLEIFLA